MTASQRVVATRPRTPPSVRRNAVFAISPRAHAEKPALVDRSPALWAWPRSSWPADVLGATRRRPGQTKTKANNNRFWMGGPGHPQARLGRLGAR